MRRLRPAVLAVLLAPLGLAHAQEAPNADPLAIADSDEQAIVRQAQLELIRARESNSAKRDLRRLAERFGKLAGDSAAKPRLSLELMILQSRACCEIEAYDGLKPVVQRQHELVRKELDPAGFYTWLSVHTDRLANLQLWRLADLQIEQAAATEPAAERAAAIQLLRADLLLRQSKLDAAKAHLRAIADDYPSVWAAATVRAGRIALRQLRIDEAEKLFTVVADRAAGTPEGEDARHMLKAIDADREKGDYPPPEPKEEPPGGSSP